MKKIFPLLTLIFYTSFSFAETLWPDAATKFLKDLDCDFAAFTIYQGPDAGILVKGQAKSIALCASSYEEKGALKRKFCWLRPLDMKQGVYTSNDNRGSSWRDENGSCTKEALTKIFNNSSIKGQIQLKAVNSEWKVVSDKLGVEKLFLDLIPKGDK